MFLSLSIENFRSIKDKQTLSFFASNTGKDHLPSHIYTAKDNNFNVIKALGIYGANASGKSNILMAFEALRYIASGTKSLDDGDTIPCYEPYALSKSTIEKPTTLEVDFLLNEDVRYSYKVSFNNLKITEESLDFYPNKVKSNVFYRDSKDTFETIKFGVNYKGGTKKIPFFDNNTYLSKAGSNASAPKMIRDVYNFFRNGCVHLSTSENFSINIDENSTSVINNISKILCYIDTGIKSINIKEQDVEIPDILNKIGNEKIKQEYIKRNKNKFMFTHVGEDGYHTEFEENMESDGTRKIFSMMGPLIDAFKKRHVFVFDEIDNGLHPHIADVLIKLFNDKSINKVGSQLIFSTHNMQIMSPEKMRRDQIWLSEKNEGKTKIYSLSDFDSRQVKSSTPYSSWYDDGRFGGVPVVNFSKIKELIVNINGDLPDIDQGLFSEEI
ncbi:Predicted ATPase [Shigella sonnei]|uniref:AAA family ATPase n=1 Tax=Shigella sonnei TaxID=624 RepID=UPI000972FAB6|nr:ATP-binding protein [Shigella sonnei]SIY10559.1 Predicted ATPase [Shigella sonnei]